MLQCPQCGREFEAGLTACPYDGATLSADKTVRTGEPTGPSSTQEPADAGPAGDSLLGRTLDGKYRLDEVLGAGGMGAVYRATHLLIDRPVAVKVLRHKFVDDESARERFRREARAAGRLQHANAVAVTDFGETREGLVYIVMELLEGKTLREVIARDAPLDPARAVSLTLQAAAAVAAAHEAGVIHRDLKPGNIFVVQRPNSPHHVKVLDFGIAKIAGDGADGDTPDTLTGAGDLVGTPRYMSPEQCEGRPDLTPASDVYSLGVILYETLTGRPPFEGATPLALALRHASEDPRPPREINPAIPPALEGFVLQALSKEPRERFADAAEFRRELYAVAERLGLEHSAGFSAPTAEALRESGVETPSGRLVVDMERIRRSRATANTAGADEPPADAHARPESRQGAGADAPPSGQSVAPPEAVRSSAGREPGGDTGPAGVTRTHVRPRSGGPLGERLTEPPVLVGLICLALLVFFGGLLWWRSPARAGRADGTAPNSAGRQNAAETGEAVGRTLSDVEDAPRGRDVERPATAAEFFERGTHNFSVRDYDGAVRDFRRAVELQPDFPVAHNRLGRALLLKGQFAAAAEEFRLAAGQRGGDYPAALYNLGFALQQQGRLDEAAAAYRYAAERMGGAYPDAYFQLGDIYDDQPATLPEAAAAYRKAIEQNGGRDPEALNKLGVVLARSDDLEGAEASFREAIAQRGGDFAYAHFNLALVYEKMNRLPEAVGEYETFLRQAPRDENRRAAEGSIRELRRRISREGDGRQ